MSNETLFTGIVERRLLYTGTKSEHFGLVLITDTGTYKIRRQGENPFKDPVLEALAGSTITCKGLLRESVVLITEIVRVEGKK